MTAVVSLQNGMSHEYEKEMSYISSTNNEITEDNGSESKLKDEKKEDIEMTSEPSLESMGLQPEAEEDSASSSVLKTSVNIVSPKGSTKRKSDPKPKTLCEQLLGEVTQSQQDAIDRISTKEGLIQMKKWLEIATNGQQYKHLCMLLAQCWKAKIDVIFLSDTGIAKFVRELKKHPEKDVRTTSAEVLKKWKTDVAREADLAAAGAAKSAPIKSASVTVKPPCQVSSSFPSKPQSSTPVVPKIEKKNEVVSRPKTARTKNTKFRKTGFEEDDEKEEPIPPPKKPASTMLSTPITKTIIPKKSPGSAVVSNSFMNALSAGSANAVELQKKRKKPPPVIDLPLNSPLEPVTVTTPGATVPPSTVPESDPNGPNPARVPIPGSKRRIHFADDKGEELVLIKYIENVLLNKTHRPSSDMKHADAEAERISMKQRKTDVEEEDDEDMQIEMQSSGNNDIADWQPIAYCDPEVKEFCSELVEEENVREGSAMRSFIPQPDIPIEHPAEPDNVDYAYTKPREPQNIPVDFVAEEVDEQEVMEVDEAPASPDTSSANIPSTVSPTPVPAVSNYTTPTVSTSSSNTSAFEILSFDVHGGGHHAHPPRPVPFPLNPPNFSLPPPSLTSKATPQPVPAPAEELVILADQPNKLNAPRLSNPAINAQSLLQRLQGKGKSLDDFLEKVKGSKAPLSNVPSSSASSTIVPNFSVPPPPIVHPVATANDLQIIDNVDIHQSIPFNAPPKQTQFGQPMAPPSRQPPLRQAPGSSGKICNFFLKGTCTFGNNCYNEHTQPQQQPMDFRSSTNTRFNNTNNRGRGAGNTRGRFNPSMNKAPFNSSNQNSSEMSQEQDNFYRSRKRNDEYRGGRRNRSRSPSPRKTRRRSRSGEGSPERYRRRRSRSPRSRSSSPDNKEDYRRSRRRSRSRSASRSPILSRSQSPNHS